MRFNWIFSFRSRVLLLVTLMSVGITSSCKTPGTVSAVKDIDDSSPELQAMDAAQRKSWQPCQGADRMSTKDLEGYLASKIRDDVPWQAYQDSWPFKVDEQKLRTDWRDEALVGGFFGMGVQELGGVPIYDNLMRYQWSLDGQSRFISGPGRGYAHVIPQRNSPDQPEMVKFMKEGDIIVYFHPERRRGGLASLQQWRATHAATIMEMPSEGGQLPCNLTTADTPSGYARPFNGSSTTPFHVFRPIHRERDNNGRYKPYDAELNHWKRAQIPRVASLAFDKFDFNGDYNSMTVKAPRDLDIFEQAYLTQSSIPRLYCAWFVFNNLNLGMMRPMTSATRTPPMTFTGAKQISHRYGDGDFAKFYQTPDAVVQKYPGAFARNASEFFMHPLTGPELAVGFLDRVIGPDKFIPTGDSDGPEPWVRHVKTKIMLLENLKPQLVQLYQARPSGIQGLNPGALFQNPDGISVNEANSRLAAKYNERIIEMYDRVLEMYKKSVADELLASDNAMRRIRSYKGRIRSVVAKIIESERTGVRQSGVYRVENQEFGTMEFPVFGNKWIPPYGYARHAEHHDHFYEPTSTDIDSKKPKLVYVGTVIHEKFLQGTGLRPVPMTRATSVDQQGTTAAKEKMTALGVDVGDDLNSALLEYLKEAGDEKGLNEFEYQTLKTQSNHWLINAEGASDADIIAHNKYGLDPVLLQRTLLNYWNDPYLVRPAIYEGPDSTTSIAGATENLRLLMMDPVGTVGDSPAGIDEREATMHPRRTRSMICENGEAPNNFRCQ